MVSYIRDVESIRQAAKAHKVSDYHVLVKDTWPARISNWSRVQDKIYYRVEFTDPPTLEKFLETMGISDEKHDLAYWQSRFRIARSEDPIELRTPKVYLPTELEDVLASGGLVSAQDYARSRYQAQGCIQVMPDGTDRMVCADFPANDVHIPINFLKTGMFVEFYDIRREETNWAGRVVGIEKDREDGTPVVLVELLHPMPALFYPYAISPANIRPGFYSSETWVLGYRLLRAFGIQGKKPPPGQYRSDLGERMYFLNDPMPISEIWDFVQEYYPKEQAYFWQSLIWYVLPLHPETVSDSRIHQGGVFRPIPEGIDVEGLEDPSITA